jgi:uncharacterized membrane protein YhaH (DUF805 family)
VGFANAVDRVVRGPDAPPRPAPPPAAQAAYAAPPAAAAAGANSPIDYIAKCFRLYVSGNGRARRAEFGWFVLFAFVATFVAVFIDAFAFGIDPYSGEANLLLFTSLALLGLICPLISAASRRAHDFGQAGWLAALTAIPYLGFVATLVFIFVPGQPGENKYGPSPKPA